MNRYSCIVIIGLLMIAFFMLLLAPQTHAQELVTATPAQIRLASPTPMPQVNPASGAGGEQPTFAISGETATPEGALLLQLREGVSDANIRSGPEITDENQIGTIREGERYAIVGRYFNWVQFQYEFAEDNRAWVYVDLIDILGDESQIPIIDLNATPTLDPLIAGATQTREGILAQPGGVLTITAQSRIIQLPPGEDGVARSSFDSNGEARPTFTYPPNVIAGLPTLEVTRDVEISSPVSNRAATNTGIPPLLPIMVLAGLGLLGVLYSIANN